MELVFTFLGSVALLVAGILFLVRPKEVNHFFIQGNPIAPYLSDDTYRGMESWSFVLMTRGFGIVLIWLACLIPFLAIKELIQPKPSTVTQPNSVSPAENSTQ